MHQKPNSFAISNWSHHAAECRRKNKNQPSITSFLKESPHNDKVDTVQSDAACVDNCPVKKSPLNYLLLTLKASRFFGKPLLLLKNRRGPKRCIYTRKGCS